MSDAVDRNETVEMVSIPVSIGSDLIRTASNQKNGLNSVEKLVTSLSKLLSHNVSFGAPCKD